MSRQPYYPHVFRPAGHETAQFPTVTSVAGSSLSPPLSQPSRGAAYSAVAAAAIAAGYGHPAVTCTSGPAVHDVRWLGAAMPPYTMRAPAAPTAQSQVLMRDERERGDVAVPVSRMHVHDAQAAVEIYALEQRRIKQLQQQQQQAAAAEVRRMRRPTLLPVSGTSAAPDFYSGVPSAVGPGAVVSQSAMAAAAMVQQVVNSTARDDRPQLIHPAFRYGDQDAVIQQLSSAAVSGQPLLVHQRPPAPLPAPPTKVRILDAKSAPSSAGAGTLIVPVSSRSTPVSVVNDVRLPLHIVTSEPTTTGFPTSMAPSSGFTHRESYNPQTEAISPTLPSDSLDESPLRSTKDDLLQQISTIDREIMKTESLIAKLKRKQNELEDQANKPDVEPDVEEDEKETKNRSLAQIIYLENRKRAKTSSEQFEHLMSEVPSPNPAWWKPYMVCQPLYNQPSDAAVYHTNMAAFARFKPRLVAVLCRRWQQQYRDTCIAIDTYASRISAWLRDVERTENLPKNRQKAVKNREFYEKVFPEIKKAREERERFNRVGRMIKSDAEMEEVLDGIQEQENEVKKMRAMAVVPPPILPAERRRLVFLNTNGRITDDPLQLHNEQPNRNVWVDSERDLFRERYLQHPKQFHLLSAALERKNTAECVKHYYLSKKQEKYKERLKKARTRGRNRGLAKPTAAAVEVIGANVSGVTTRGSVAAMQREKAQAAGGAGSDSAVVTGCEDKPAAVAAQPPSAALPTESAPLSPQATTAAPQTLDAGEFADTRLDKRRERRKGEEERRRNVLSSDEEEAAVSAGGLVDGVAGSGGPHSCAVCLAQLEHFGQSRPLLAARASIYGLSEESLPADARVCTACRCRSVKRRYSHIKCPIPTCPTPKFRVKRLRPLPSRWADISDELRQTIMKELQIAPEVVKCCPACHNRMARRIGQADGQDPGVDASQWREDEVERLRNAIRVHGARWSKLCEAVGGNRSPSQCKRFYIESKVRCRLEEVMAEFKRLNGYRDGTLSNEDTVSCSSSADELATPPEPLAPADIDKCGAGGGGAGPCPHAANGAAPASSQTATPVVTNGNHERGDSSETVSADEAAETEHQSTVKQNCTPISSGSVAAYVATSPVLASATDVCQSGTPPVTAVSAVGAPVSSPATTADVIARTRTNVVMGDLIDVTINNSFRYSKHKQSPPEQQQQVSVPPSAASPALTINTLLAAPERGALQPPVAADQGEHAQDLSVRRDQQQQPYRPAAQPVRHQHPVTSPAPLGLLRSRAMAGGVVLMDTPPPAHRVVSRSADFRALDPPRDSYLPMPPSELAVRSPARHVFMTDPRATLPLPRPVGMTPLTTLPTSLRPPVPQPRQHPPPLVTRAVPAPPPAHARAGDVKTLPISVRASGGGSITQGTPVVSVPSHQHPQHQQQQYEGLLRSLVPHTPHAAVPTHLKEAVGSITQGTPVQHGDAQKRRDPGVLVVVQDGRQVARASPNHQHHQHHHPHQPGTGYQYHPALQRQHVQHPHQPPPPRTPEQPMSSRHVIMTDYITSQQMQQERRQPDKPGSSGSPTSVYLPPGYAAPPASNFLRNPAVTSQQQRQQQQQQQRQGVIQRPVPSRAQPSKPSPRPPSDDAFLKHHHQQQQQQQQYTGQDNFNTLVDVAVVLGERERDQRYGRPSMPHHDHRIRDHVVTSRPAVTHATSAVIPAPALQDKRNLTTMGLIETIISRSINQEGRAAPSTVVSSSPSLSANDAAVADMRANYRVARSPSVPTISRSGELVMVEPHDQRPASRGGPPDESCPARSTPMPQAVVYTQGRFPMSAPPPRMTVNSAHRLHPGLVPPHTPQQPAQPPDSYAYRYRKPLPTHQTEAERLSLIEQRARCHPRDERQIIRVAQPGDSPATQYGYDMSTKPSGARVALHSPQQQQRRHYAEQTARPGIASPLDYVKYKIAEVMRTSEHGESAPADLSPAATPERRPPSVGMPAARALSPAVVAFDGVKRPRLELPHDTPGGATDLRTKIADGEHKASRPPSGPGAFYPYKSVSNGELHNLSYPGVARSSPLLMPPSLTRVPHATTVSPQQQHVPLMAGRYQDISDDD